MTGVAAVCMTEGEADCMTGVTVGTVVVVVTTAGAGAALAVSFGAAFLTNVVLPL